jgi:hypothetical protein
VCRGERGKERRQRASHPKQHHSRQECLQTSPDKREAFVTKKATQLHEEASIEIERHRSILDSRKLYKRLNEIRRPFKPLVAMCLAKKEELLTNKNQVLARWKEHFEEHLNEGNIKDDEIPEKQEGSRRRFYRG